MIVDSSQGTLLGAKSILEEANVLKVKFGIDVATAYVETA